MKSEEEMQEAALPLEPQEIENKREEKKSELTRMRILRKMIISLEKGRSM